MVNKLRNFKITDTVNINTVCTNGMTPLGAACHMGNMAICELLIDSYKRQLEKDDTYHKNKKLCLSLNNDYNDFTCKQKKNVGYFVVNKDLDNNQQTVEIGDGPTPEGMEGLEWDLEFRETEEVTPEESNSSIYQWYADILNRTSDLLKNPLPCDINQFDRYGQTALHYAAERGHVGITQLLITNGSNVNLTSPTDGYSALHIATGKGCCDLVSILIKAGARVDELTSSKLTPLHIAAQCGHLKVMQMLINLGAKVDSMDSSERTPLVKAVSTRQEKCLELLIRNGARVNIEDINGHTPLCQAVWTNSRETVSSLISSGAKITQSHYLLHYSVMNDHLEIAQELIKAGSVVNLRDGNGNTPLILAARSGCLNTAKYLLDHGMYNFKHVAFIRKIIRLVS